MFVYQSDYQQPVGTETNYCVIFYVLACQLRNPLRRDALSYILVKNKIIFSFLVYMLAIFCVFNRLTLPNYKLLFVVFQV